MIAPNQRGVSAYRSVGVETRAQAHDQYQLVLMMYETVLENLARARGAIEQGNTSAKLEHINKVVRILQEGLRTSLDLENGGELAANLAALYDYCMLRVTQANAANSADMLEEVSQLIRPLVEAWKQMRPAQPTPDNPATPPSGAAEPDKHAKPVVKRGYDAAFASVHPSSALANA